MSFIEPDAFDHQLAEDILRELGVPSEYIAPGNPTVVSVRAQWQWDSDPLGPSEVGRPWQPKATVFVAQSEIEEPAQGAFIRMVGRRDYVVEEFLPRVAMWAMRVVPADVESL